MAKVLYPFKSSVGAWFWFWQNQDVRPSDDGLCQPIDILKAVDRLYAAGTLEIEHVLTLKKYGKQGRSPDPAVDRQQRAWQIWRQAHDRLEIELIKVGIVRKR